MARSKQIERLMRSIKYFKENSNFTTTTLAKVAS